MPMIKRQQFVPIKPAKDLKPDEDIFYFKLTNEIFRNYEDYFERVILCNSLVWSCSITGRINLTFQEALDSEKSAKKVLDGFPRELKVPLLLLTNLTRRGRVLDVYEDVFSYAREHYFKGEIVLAVIGNLWCHSRVTRVISPTLAELEAYKKEQIERGEYEKNDYLKDSSWGPPPDLFRYEVQETDPENANQDVHVLEAIDVKREKTCLTRDKCRNLIKLHTYYNEEERAWRVQEHVAEVLELKKLTFQDTFVGYPPIFEETLGPLKSNRKSENKSTSSTVSLHTENSKRENGVHKTKKKPAETIQPNGKVPSKPTSKVKTNSNANSHSKKKKDSETPKEKKLTPEQIKQLEFERKAQERENLKAQKKRIADFKKLWFKPKEDLEVEDLKDIPQPDPICCKIPNHLFGDFVMILEYFNCYSSVLKARDCFPSGLTFDMLERALIKNEIAGPLSDILQQLLRAIFRCQLTEESEILHEEASAASFEVGIDELSDCASAASAVQQATTAATWSAMYQNTALNKLTLDHLSVTEVLRLHLLSSGARPTEKDIKWRLQQRGGYTNIDDAGLQLRMEEPQILKTLALGTIFDLSLHERMKVVHCLINQLIAYVSVRDIIDESFEQFKQARINLRTIQAAERRKENEDNVWRQKLKTEKRLPSPDFMKSQSSNNSEKKEGVDQTTESDKAKLKQELKEEQIEAHLVKRDKETARRKQDYEWKVSELVDMINKHERKLGLHPIGRDRAFRRYWVFATLPGLFVEDDDYTIGPCLSSPTPRYSEVNLEDLKFVEANFEKLKQDKDGSDKENSTSVTPTRPPKKKCTDMALEKQPEIYGTCSGEPTTCRVHGKRSTKWHFYWNSDQLEGLLSGLTPRGIRENELRTYLKEEKSGITNILQRCPIRKLNNEKEYPESMVSVLERRPARGAGQGGTKGGLDPYLNFPPTTPIETILELQLRDLILEIEEKIFLGALGSLKVNDRMEWRKAIEQRSYDPQVETVRWGEGKSQSLAGQLLGVTVSSLQEGSDIKQGTSQCETEDATELNANPAIKCLACAILQLEQSVEPKFFTKPLGDKEEDKKKKSKGDVDQAISKGKWIQGSALQRWESSLLKCTSFSQLSIHLFTLDNSIEWTRSVLNARCRVCRRKGDSENMLLCDSCNKGHHLYCVKPPLDAVPAGDWFCSDCRPAEPVARKRPSRKVYVSDEEEMSEDSNQNLESENGEEGSNRASPGPASLEVRGSEVEVCRECGLGGEVILCDNCPLVYHLQCLDPPKSRVPRGTWYCPECDKPHRKSGKGKKAKKKLLVPRGKKRRIISSSESEEDENEEEVVNERSTDETDQDEQSENESDVSSGVAPEMPLVKMKFRTRKPVSNYSTRSSDFKIEDSGDESEDLGHRNKRKCASQAVAKIAKAVKRLRSDSKENDESSNESSSSSSINTNMARKYDLDNQEDSDTVTKKTRLHRVNRCGESGDLDNVLLDKLVNEIMKQSSAWPFLKPVTRHDAPDYHEIIKFPMDLGTIKYKLNSMVYTCNQEFFGDLQQVFDNCFLYNQKENDVYRAGETLRAFCEKRCSNLGFSFFSDVTTS